VIRAEGPFPSEDLVLASRDSVYIERASLADIRKTRKAVRQQDGLLFSRENSSNGVLRKDHQNFLAKILLGYESQCQGIYPE
jgi:hypothetical protein